MSIHMFPTRFIVSMIWPLLHMHQSVRHSCNVLEMESLYTVGQFAFVEICTTSRSAAEAPYLRYPNLANTR
jgi:hypothetical protein